MSGGTNMVFNPFRVLDSAFGFSEKKQQKREDEVAQRNYQWAKEFAQNSMQWKAEDLRKAGINPIYGMGSGGYSAPVSSTSPVDLAPAGSISFSKEDKEIKQAQANKTNAEANKTNAEAKAVQKISEGVEKAVNQGTDYQYLQGADGVNRIFQSQEATEALENDMIGRLGWHGRALAPLHGTQLEEFRNNLWNSLLTKGVVNPFTDDIVVNSDRSYTVVPRGSKEAKQDKWRKVDEPYYRKKNTPKVYGTGYDEYRFPF